MKRGLAGLVSLAALIGCYQPNWVDGQYKCEADADCPSGLICRASLCYHAAPADEDLSSGEGDLAGGADMRGGGGGASDLREGGGDMSVAPACTVSGEPLGAGGAVWACRGGFRAMGAGALCGSGYHACSLGSTADVFRLAAANRDCPAGFYTVLGETTFRGGNNQEQRCDMPRMGDYSALVGCGSEGGTFSLANYNLCTPLRQVDLLRSAFRCGTAGQAWSCTGSLADATHTYTDRGGILCCRN